MVYIDDLDSMAEHYLQDSNVFQLLSLLWTVYQKCSQDCRIEIERFSLDLIRNRIEGDIDED